MNRVMKYCIALLGVIVTAMIAILVHALLPSPGAVLDPNAFNGMLVQMFGFPMVASMYFIVLYLHILIVIRCYGRKSSLSRKEIGIRYGLAFGLMYLGGMQEVVVEGSPLSAYGIDFILYEFFMGLGDAIPVVFLCILISHCIINKKEVGTINNLGNQKTIRFFVITILFFIERIIGYYMGYIDSDIHRYPVPVLIWTAVFGSIFGVMYFLLEPIYTSVNNIKKQIQIISLSIGINWIWFNCFIGLIMKDSFIKMLLRGGMDILVITTGCVFLEFILKSTRSVHN